MDAPVRVPRPEVAEYVPPEYCEYCGAKLDPNFYFCLMCATPYKDVRRVVEPAAPMRLTDGQLIEKKAPQVASLFWSFFVVVVGTAIVAHLLFEEDRPGLALIFQTVAIAVATCVWAAMHWRSLAVQLKQMGFARPEALLAIVALAPLLGVNYLYHGWLVQQMGIENAHPFARLRASGMDETALIFLYCILPAVTEEIAFRGLLQHWLQVAVAPTRAIVLASALFMAMHFSVLSAPYLFALGFLLGWTKWKTRSLYPSMLVHFLHNLIVLEFFRF